VLQDADQRPRRDRRNLEIFLEYPDDFGPGREIGSVEVDLHDPANAELIKAIAYVNNKAKIAI
jgi:hypothetical protein